MNKFPDMTSNLCDLCGLPLRYGVSTLKISDTTYRFCCSGCRQVFTMLMDAADAKDPAQFKETELFKQCVAMGILPASEADLEKRAASGTDNTPKLSQEIAGEDRGVPEPRADKNRLDLNLNVSGMWCPACAWVISQTLNRQAGVTGTVCDFSTDRVRCQYDPVSTSPERIIQTVGRLGYRAVRPGTDDPAGEGQTEFIRFGISAFLTMNVMMLAFALYSGFFTELSSDSITKLSWPMFVMASVVFFYGGWHIHWKALSGIRSLAPGMETLITIGSGSAYLYSTCNLLVGSIHLYYDTAAMLITLVLLGKLLERRSKDSVQEDLGSFFALRPTKVRLCNDTYPQGRYVNAEQLQKGDLFRVDEDEIVPADGVVLQGEGSVDESSVTGESRSVSKKTGDFLTSGTRVLAGSFRVRAERVDDDSTLGQMIRIMEKSLSEKTPLEGKTDRILLWFVPMVATLAAGTATVCLLAGMSGTQAMIRAITILVISCPCALGIAIPLARVAGISLAVKNGILVRNFSAFEMAERVRAFVFDKTGTLTEGRWRLLEMTPLGDTSYHGGLALAAGIEKDSDHLVAREIRRQADKRGLAPVPIQNCFDHGNGISGQWDGKPIKIGSRDFLSDSVGIPPSPFRIDQISEENAIFSEVYMSLGGELASIFIFGDNIKGGAKEAIAQLAHSGYHISLISGDGEETTRAVAEKTGIREACGGRLPEEKADFIQSLQTPGRRVAMVGDGINDAPALARADLAVAMHSGYHLGKEVADVTLMRGDPAQVVAFLRLAKRVNRKVVQNLLCSLVYNAIAIPVAMAGLLTPIVAVSAMLMSSLSVTGNTLRLLKEEKRSPGAAGDKEENIRRFL